MEAVIDLLISLNKISLVALVITVGFVSYQIYHLKKETEGKRKNLVIPEFKPSTNTSFTQATKVIVPEEKKVYMKASIIPIVIGIILFFIFGIVFVFGLMHQKSDVETKNKELGPTPIVNFVASKGIKIYNQNWKEFSDELLKKVKPGEHIVLGIETVRQADIDMARIRINKSVWSQEDICTQFNKQLNIYFREYVISTGEAFLKIEAQLHSKTDGWLGD